MTFIGLPEFQTALISRTQLKFGRTNRVKAALAAVAGVVIFARENGAVFTAPIHSLKGFRAELLRDFLVAVAILIDPLLVTFRTLLARLAIALIRPARLRLAFAFLVRLLLVRHGVAPVLPALASPTNEGAGRSGKTAVPSDA